jgi:hypothetical protein
VQLTEGMREKTLGFVQVDVQKDALEKLDHHWRRQLLDRQ